MINECSPLFQNIISNNGENYNINAMEVLNLKFNFLIFIKVLILIKAQF